MSERVRKRIHVAGTVQGVGFRPFVYRTAVGRKLAGFVRNLGDAGVEIEIDEDGFVVDPEQWTEDVARYFAVAEGIKDRKSVV